MAVTGRIRRRLALAIVLTALIPVSVAILLAESWVRGTSSSFFFPEIGLRLDQSLGLYQELARSIKARMRAEATAVAAHQPLRDAVEQGDSAAMRRELRQRFREFPDLVSLTVENAAGERMARVDRGRPIDAKKENKLEVRRPLTDDAEMADDAPVLVAVFAADKARFEELEEMSQFVDTYKQVEQRRAGGSPYVYAFAALLGITILMAVGVGTAMARGVSSRIAGLAEATKRVGAGDLSIRVPEDGSDEISDLARAFNRMLAEVEASRARIEYLQRIAAWQEMARRLAHEIKNPLTPIQLAVQEMHRRYSGDDANYKKLVDTTLEIVEDEVGTLRRLVSEFSDFARLPQADLELADFVEFLTEQRERIAVLDHDEDAAEGEDGVTDLSGIKFHFDLPDAAAQVYMDRQMLRRALLNLVRNAVQAIRGAGREQGHIDLSLKRHGEYWQLDLDDDGPGISEDMRHVVFDPYITTKTEGTGLGLAIVKKIVVEHGGTISARKSPRGGARMRLSLPAAGTAVSDATLESRQWQGPPSSARPSVGSGPASPG